MNPGELCVIKHDVIVGGELAFKAGETVVLEKIEPNAQRPEYQFVVFSNSMQKMFQLSGNDVGPSVASVSEPWGAPRAPYVPPRLSTKPAVEGSRWRRIVGVPHNRVLLITFIVVIAVIGVFVGVKVAKGGPGPEAIARTFFDEGVAHDVPAMIAMLDPETYAKNPSQKLRLESNFGSRNYGLGYTTALKYTTTVNGDTAKVVVTVNSNIIRDNLSPPNTMVTFSTLEMVKKNGKWLITQFLMAW